jgi:hypothetical protein
MLSYFPEAAQDLQENSNGNQNQNLGTIKMTGVTTMMHSSHGLLKIHLIHLIVDHRVLQNYHTLNPTASGFTTSITAPPIWTTTATG